MPYPLAHGLIGASVVAVAAENPPGRSKKLLLLGFALGVCPDLDFILVWFLRFDKTWHRGFSHSLLFALLVALVIAILARGRRMRTFVVCGLAVTSHAVLDALCSVKYGVPFFWPWWRHFAFGLFDYPDAFHLKYYFSSDVLVLSGVRRLVKISVIEAVGGGAVFVCALLGRHFYDGTSSRQNQNFSRGR